MYYKHYWKFYFKALNFDWKKFLSGEKIKPRKMRLIRIWKLKKKGFFLVEDINACNKSL